MVNGVEEQKSIYRERSVRGYLQSVIDPDDKKGVKVHYIDLWSKHYLRKFLRMEKDDIILDFGCGVGRLTEFVGKRCAKSIGIDISQELLSVANNNRSRRRNTFYYLPQEFPNDKVKYDKLFTCWVLQCIIPDEIVKETLLRYTKGRTGLQCVFIEQATLNMFDVHLDDGRFLKRIRTIDNWMEIFEAVGLRLIKHYIINEKEYGLYYRLLPKVRPYLMNWMRVFNHIGFYFDKVTVRRRLEEGKYTDCIFICEKE